MRTSRSFRAPAVDTRPGSSSAYQEDDAGNEGADVADASAGAGAADAGAGAAGASACAALAAGAACGGEAPAAPAPAPSPVEKAGALGAQAMKKTAEADAN